MTSRLHTVFSGDNRSAWVRLCLEDDSFYYFHLNRLEGSWEKPPGFLQNSVFLDRQQIQVRQVFIGFSSSRKVAG